MRFLSKLMSRSKGASKRVARTRLCVEELESRLVPYAVSGNAWPHPELITISFVPDGTIIGANSNGYIYSNLFATLNAHSGWTTATWQKQILKAAEAWAQQTNINFAVVPDNGAALGTGNYQQGDPNMGDIRIAGYNFGSSNTAIAMANQPPPVNNYSIAGDITFNTGDPFNIGSTYDLFTVAAHEFGHALGMDHSSIAQAIMYATYNGTKSGLYSDDAAGIENMYSNNSPRTGDAYDGNGSFATAANISSQIDPLALTAVLNNLDLTSINGYNGFRTTTETDYFTFTAPAATSNTLTVKVQSTGLSLLAPVMTVYAADQMTVLGSASGAGQYGATLTVTVSNVTAGQQFYVKVAGSETTTLGSGKYALALNLGTGSMLAVTIPNTQTLNGNPLSAGGGMADSPGPDQGPGGGVGDQYSDHAENASGAAKTTDAPPSRGSRTDRDVLADLASAGLGLAFSGPAAGASSGWSHSLAGELSSHGRADDLAEKTLVREGRVGTAESWERIFADEGQEATGLEHGARWQEALDACFADALADALSS
jgi:hypothetical protein